MTPNPLTRREFSLLATGSLALVVLNQAPALAQSAAEEKNKANLAAEPFLIGPAEKFKAAGIYEDFKKAKGVWLVSDGQMLVALSATCTHLGCSTKSNPEKKGFICPCHESKFDAQGLNIRGKARRPLERCALRRVTGPSGGPEVEVDPRKRFRKDKNEWSDPASSLALG